MNTTSLRTSGNIARAQGQYERAVALYTKAIIIHREFESERAQDLVSQSLALVFETLSHRDRAFELKSRANDIKSEVGTKPREALARRSPGIVLLGACACACAIACAPAADLLHEEPTTRVEMSEEVREMVDEPASETVGLTARESTALTSEERYEMYAEIMDGLADRLIADGCTVTSSFNGNYTPGATFNVRAKSPAAVITYDIHGSTSLDADLSGSMSGDVFLGREESRRYAGAVTLEAWEGRAQGQIIFVDGFELDVEAALIDRMDLIRPGGHMLGVAGVCPE